MLDVFETRMSEPPTDPPGAKAVLIDFNTVIDPVALFTCLLVFRKSHDRIHVRGDALVYQSHDLDSPSPVPELGNLTDPHALAMASSVCRRNADDLQFAPNNLCLALRLLQHAIDEGIVVVLNDHLFGEWYGADKRVSVEDVRSVPCFEFLDRRIHTGGLYGRTVLEPDTPGRYWDVAMSLRQGWDVAIGGRTFDARELVSAGSLGDGMAGGKTDNADSLLRRLHTDKFSTYTALLDHPDLLQTVSDAAIAVSKDAQYKNDLRWFLPRYLLDAATLSTYSLLEMLWVIIKRQRAGRRADERT